MATRFLVDLKKERRIRAEVAAFDKELREAMNSKDKDKEEKLKKKKPTIDKMRLSMSSGRLKVTAVTWLPFIILYYFTADYIGGCSFISPKTHFLNICISNVVAYSPLPLGVPFLGGGMALIWWYFLSSLTFSGIMTRLLGTSQTS